VASPILLEVLLSTPIVEYQAFPEQSETTEYLIARGVAIDNETDYVLKEKDDDVHDDELRLIVGATDNASATSFDRWQYRSTPGGECHGDLPQ
jgi:hypothetical protein